MDVFLGYADTNEVTHGGEVIAFNTLGCPSYCKTDISIILEIYDYFLQFMHFSSNEHRGATEESLTGLSFTALYTVAVKVTNSNDDECYGC